MSPESSTSKDKPATAAITAFAITFSLGLYYPGLLAGLIFCALSVAASRVILGLHYVSDVLVGIVIGCAIGIAAFLSPLPLLLSSLVSGL